MMRRRTFLKSTTAATAGAVAAAYVRPAQAQARKETLLTVSESGPNNLDIMGIGTNRPGYEASWNTHDRLVTFGIKQTPAATIITITRRSNPSWPNPGTSETVRQLSSCGAARHSTTAVRSRPRTSNGRSTAQ